VKKPYRDLNDECEEELLEGDWEKLYLKYLRYHGDQDSSLRKRSSFCEEVDRLYGLSEDDWEKLMDDTVGGEDPIYRFRLEEDELRSVLELRYD